MKYLDNKVQIHQIINFLWLRIIALKNRVAFKLNKANGWHRLWLVFCAFSFIFWMLSAVRDAPPPSLYPYMPESYNALTTESKNTILEINVMDTSGAFVHSFKEIETDKNKNRPWLISLAGSSWKNLLIKMPNEQVIAFKDSASIDDIRKACQEYWGIVKKYAREQEETFFAYYLMYWFFLCSFLYVLGITVNWISRGFKSKTPN